jgi:organic radical activating enzyme
MLAIWGIDELSLKFYNRLSEKEREKVCFVVSDAQQPKEMIGKLAMSSLDKLQLDKVEKLLIPTKGIFGNSSNYDRIIYRTVLQKTNLSDDKIWLMDYKTFDLELKERGSLDAFLASNTIPYIFHLEFEVTHHCNLNCRGCTHFTPLSKKKFGNLEQFIKDLERIHKMVDHLGQILLLGGEPLLNPDLNRFIEESHRIYPDAEIKVISNGMLLGSISDSLIDTMKRTNTILSVSLYPPIMNYVKEKLNKVALKGIHIEEFHDCNVFASMILPECKSNASKAYAMCIQSGCHIFEDGRLSSCALAHKTPVFEEYFNLEHVYPDCSIDLYADDLTPQKLQAYLMNPIEMCRFCGKPKSFPWAPAGKAPKKEDWYCTEPYC